MSNQESFKIESRYNFDVLHNSINYPEFKGNSRNEFMLYLINIRANLTGADLTRANLTRANLTGADLTRADLTRANLTGADLTRANLTGVDLTGANLTGADLTRANLTGANLTGADLTGADLTGADLTRADLTDYCYWSIRFQLPNIIKIGCKTKTIKEWDYFFNKSDETFDHSRDSNTFKRIKIKYQSTKLYIKECLKEGLFKEEIDENGNKKWISL